MKFATTGGANLQLTYQVDTKTPLASSRFGFANVVLSQRAAESARVTRAKLRQAPSLFFGE